MAETFDTRQNRIKRLILVMRTSGDDGKCGQNTAKKPTNIVTSFAGYDIDAVRQARTYLVPYPPSSPAIALLKDGQVVHMIERHMIEGRPAQMIAQNLMQAFEQHC